jgi:uncharacterized protein YerC
MDKSQFKIKLKELRKKGITNADIAKKTGYSTMTVDRASGNFSDASKRFYEIFKLKFK